MIELPSTGRGVCRSCSAEERKTKEERRRRRTKKKNKNEKNGTAEAHTETASVQTITGLPAIARSLRVAFLASFGAPNLTHLPSLEEKEFDPSIHLAHFYWLTWPSYVHLAHFYWLPGLAPSHLAHFYRLLCLAPSTWHISIGRLA